MRDVLVLALVFSSISAKRDSYDNECSIWEQISKKLSEEENVEMICNHNFQCTGFDCDGTYGYKGMLTLNKNFELDYCFGMFVMPCSTPPNMKFYIDFPTESNSYELIVNSSRQIQVPGIQYDIVNVGTAVPFVSVDMKTEKKDGKTFMTLGLKLKVRISMFGGIYQTWPEQLQRTLMPDAEVQVPDCDTDITTPSHDPKTCKVYVPSSTTTVRPTTVTQKNDEKTSNNATDTKAKSSNVTHATDKTKKIETCHMNVAYQCDENELCDPITNISGVCRCMSGYVRSPDGCKRFISHTTPIPIYYMDLAKKLTKDGKSNHAVLIACSVGIVVFIVALVAGLLLYKYKKYRIRYRDHQLLLNNDDNDDDDPLDLTDDD